MILGLEIDSFTSNLRDHETGLDFMGARYMSSAQGRFTSPDPLLNSGRPWEPQSWNRYAYVRNNPLKYVDPTGLYDLDNTCLQTDKACNKTFNDNAKRLGNAISDLQKQAAKAKDPAQKARLQAALTALGTQGDHNGVFVGFGSLQAGTGATAVPFDAGNGTINYRVTFDLTQTAPGNDLAINAAHEGTHVSDLSDPRFNNLATTLSPFSLEYRGYQTSAWATQALGERQKSFNGNLIWNQSWKAVDRIKLMDSGITNYLTTRPRDPLPATTPHNPRPN